MSLIPPAYLQAMIPTWRDSLLRTINRCEEMGDPLGELPMLRADLALAEDTIKKARLQATDRSMHEGTGESNAG